MKLQCMNYRLELAVKASKHFTFISVGKQYVKIFNLLKNSEAIRRDTKAAVKSQDISFYSLPKITGTRFASQCRKAYTCFLMWPATIITLDNASAHRPGMKAETKTKFTGFHKKFGSFKYLTPMCS